MPLDLSCVSFGENVCVCVCMCMRVCVCSRARVRVCVGVCGVFLSPGFFGGFKGFLINYLSRLPLSAYFVFASWLFLLLVAFVRIAVSYFTV